MSVARSVARSVAKSVARSVAVGESGDGSAPTPWSPLDLPGLQAYSLDDQKYLDSQLNDVWYAKPQAPYGTLREPLPACVADFDGLNDYAATTANITPPAVVGFSCWFRSTGISTRAIIGIASATSALQHFTVYIDGSGFITLARRNPTNIATVVNNDKNYHDGQWHHLYVEATDAGTIRSVVDGGAVQTYTAAPVSLSGVADLRGIIGVFRVSSAAFFFDGSLADARVYNVAKTPTQIAAIYNNGKSDWRSAAGVDTASIVAGWALNDRVGTTFRDWSGNGRHLTIYNADTTYLGASSIHKTDSELQFNPANEVGYTAGAGGLVIPRDESDAANDVNGDPLDYTGKAPLLVQVDTPCITRDAAGTVYLSAPHLSGSETVVSWLGSTTEPTISSGRIDWDNSTTLASLFLSDGTTYHCQEGTARAIADSGGSNDATIVGGDTANIWANKIPGLVKDVTLESTGVPGTYSVLNLNPNAAATFNGRDVPTDYSPSANNLNTVVTPTDTAFIASNGTKIVIVEDTLAGTDLSNIEAYVTG